MATIKNKEMKKNYLNSAVPSDFEGNGEQRNISYGELAALQELFDQQVEEFNIGFECDEEREEALFDFIQQYINGNDDPQIEYVDQDLQAINHVDLDKAEDMESEPLKAPTQAIDDVTLATIEQHLKDGKFELVKQELEEVIDQTGDTRSRVAYYRLLFYLSGNSGSDMSTIKHQVLMAAQSNHICSMNLVDELHVSYIDTDPRYWRRLSEILDPKGDLTYNLDHFKSIEINDIIDALHEPDSHFYNAVEAEKQAIRFGLTAPGTLHYDEATFFNNGDEKLLDEAHAHMRARDEAAAEESYHKLEAINPAHGAFALSMHHHSLKQYDKFVQYVLKGAELGIVAHMYVLSAIYRCGFGGAMKSPDLADAWFWLATECDNKQYRGLDTVFDFDFLPLDMWLLGWRHYFDNPSSQVP